MNIETLQQSQVRLTRKLVVAENDGLCLKNAIKDSIVISCICRTQLVLTKPVIVYKASAAWYVFIFVIIQSIIIFVIIQRYLSECDPSQ